MTVERAWNRLLGALPPADRVSAHEVGVPISFVGGTLRIGVRRDLWRARLRDQLGALDLEALVPGGRRVEVVVELEDGRSGREVLAEEDQLRRAAARAAVEASEPVHRLIRAFDAELGEIVPFIPAGAADVPVVEEPAED